MPTLVEAPSLILSPLGRVSRFELAPYHRLNEAFYATKSLRYDGDPKACQLEVWEGRSYAWNAIAQQLERGLYEDLIEIYSPCNLLIRSDGFILTYG